MKKKLLTMLLADRLEIYFDEEMNHQLRGVSRRESLEILLRNYRGKPFSEEQKIKLMEEKKSILPQDVGSTLQKLKQMGYLMAVGSSSKNAGFILERTVKYFDKVSDGNNLQHSKPHPEVQHNT